MCQNFVVGNIGQSNGIKLIHFHEVGKNIGAQYDRSGNGNLNIFKLIETFIAFDHGIQKRQPSPLASQ
jgi:AAA15 family ATPase/GTPase